MSEIALMALDLLAGVVVFQVQQIIPIVTFVVADNNQNGILRQNISVFLFILVVCFILEVLKLYN